MSQYRKSCVDVVLRALLSVIPANVWLRLYDLTLYNPTMNLLLEG